MNNEEYGIIFKSITTQFKKGIQELSNLVKNFGKEAEEETTISPVFQADKVGYRRQIEYVESQLDALKDTFKAINAGTMQGDVTKIRNDYEILNNKLGQLIEKQKEYNEELEDMGDDGAKSTSMLSGLFDKSIGKIKRFTYYLLGARSVFSLFMKYQGIYYQYNEQMQYQSELSQNAIALSLAPAFEFLGNVVAYASIAIAKFIELLTGVNVLSKVTTKGIRDYNKSLKETQTLVSGIDEISNLTMPSGTGLASQYAALDEFQKKIAEVEKFFEENEWINKVVEFLKLAWEYTTEKILPAVGKILDKVIEIGSWIFENIIKPVGAFLYGSYEFIKFMVKAIIDVFSGNMDQFNIDLENFKENVKGIFYWFTSYSKEEEEKFAGYLEKIKEVANTGGELTLELDYQEAEKFYDYLQNSKSELADIKDKIDVTQEVDENGKVFYKFKQSTIDDLNEIEETMDETFKDRETNVTFNVDVNASKFQQKMNKIMEGYKIDGQSVIKFDNAVPLATGLDYVPYDEYPAILHKGEAVVPAKYNPTIHSQGNEYTNSLLETLIVSVQDLASRPNVFEVDGNEFAKATYPLYRNEENRQNYNAKVSVR